MEKRVIVAFVLSIAVMYVFTTLYTPRKAPEPAAGVQTPGAAPATQTPTASSAPGSSNTSVENTEPASSTTEQDSRADKAEDFVLETPLYTAIISNVGGVLKSYRLKGYPDAEGHPLELIDQPAAAKVGWPLTIITGDKAVDDELSAA